MKQSKLLILFLFISFSLSAQNNQFNPKQLDDGWKTENQLLGNS